MPQDFLMALMASLRLVWVSILQSSNRLLLWRSEGCGFWFSRTSLPALVGKLCAFGKVAVLKVGESRGYSDAISVSALRLRDSGCCCCCCGVARICWVSAGQPGLAFAEQLSAGLVYAQLASAVSAAVSVWLVSSWPHLAVLVASVPSLVVIKRRYLSQVSLIFFLGSRRDPLVSETPPLGILGPRSPCLRGHVDFHSGLLLPDSA